MYRIFFPLLSNRKKFRKSDFENWRIYNRKNHFQLTGDDPIVLKEFVDFGSLNEELIFPLSGNKILVHTKSNKPEALPSIFILRLDMLILQQAKKICVVPIRNI